MTIFCIEHSTRNSAGQLEYFWLNGWPTEDEDFNRLTTENLKYNNPGKAEKYSNKDSVSKRLREHRHPDDLPVTLVDYAKLNLHYRSAEIKSIQEIGENEKYIYPFMLQGSGLLRLPIFHEKGLFLSDRIKKDCVEGRCKILIMEPWEGHGWNSGDLDAFINAQCNIHGIPKNNIGFVDGNYYTPNIQKELGGKGFYYSYFENKEFNHGISTDNILKRINKLIENNKRSYHFLCLMRRPHRHRILLGQEIYKNWLGKILWSLPKFDVNYNLFFNKKSGIYTHVDKMIVENLLEKSFYDFLPEKIDYDNVNDLQIKPELLDKAYINLVVETKFFENNTLFFSEKIFKPIRYLQPFLLVGNYNSLSVLKDMGYKTFHPYIDESYDQIKDGDLRFKAILDEIDRLCSLSHEQLQDLMEKCFPIVLHNYNNINTATEQYIREEQLCSELSNWLYDR